jgi:radical SAM protein with 4Fe4S-binding SPASM domain
MANLGPQRKTNLKQVVVETTRRCNLRCIHCKVSPENNEGSYEAIEMPTEVFERLLPMLRTYRPRVQLSGHGETLLHRKFTYMLEQAVSAGCVVTFQTNGTLLTSKMIEEIILLGVSSITFSLDGASAEVFEKIRRGASFERVIGSIAAVAEARERLKRDVTLGVEFVAMRMNIHELPDLVSLAARLGVANIQVAHLIEYNLSRGQAVTGDPQVLPWIELAEKEAKAKGISLRLPSNLPHVDRLPVSPLSGLRKACTEPWDSLVVRANGEILPCCVILEPYGDLSTQSFEEISSNSKYQELRSALLSERPFDQCISCSFYGWEKIPPMISVSPFQRDSNAKIRSLTSPPEETTSLSDGQLFWLLWKLDAPDSLGTFNRIRQGRSSVAQSCLQLLETGGETAPEEFVSRLYRRLLKREPDPQGLAGHLQSFRSGGRSPLELVEVFLASDEFVEKLPAL